MDFKIEGWRTSWIHRALNLDSRIHSVCLRRLTPSIPWEFQFQNWLFGAAAFFNVHVAKYYRFSNPFYLHIRKNKCCIHIMLINGRLSNNQHENLPSNRSRSDLRLGRVALGCFAFGSLKRLSCFAFGLLSAGRCKFGRCFAFRLLKRLDVA